MNWITCVTPDKVSRYMILRETKWMTHNLYGGLRGYYVEEKINTSHWAAVEYHVNGGVGIMEVNKLIQQ